MIYLFGILEVDIVSLISLDRHLWPEGPVGSPDGQTDNEKKRKAFVIRLVMASYGGFHKWGTPSSLDGL